MRYATVFDTNVYQGLPRKALASVLAAESEQDLLGYADSWVLIELVSKLASTKQRAFARSALRKLWEHCGGDEELRIVTDCEEQVCRMLLDTAPAGHEETRERLVTICGRVVDEMIPEDDPEVLAAAAELDAHLAGVEGDRVRLVFDGIIKVVVPEAESWDAIATNPELQKAVAAWIDDGGAVRVLAESEVRRAHTDVGMPIPDPVPHNMIDEVLARFSYALHVESAAIRSAVVDGADMTKSGRQNSIWDAQIAFNAGQTLPEGRTIVLVTNDALLLEVARQVGEESVQPLDEYLTRRGVSIE